MTRGVAATLALAIALGRLAVMPADAGIQSAPDAQTAPALAGTWTLDAAATGRGRANFAGFATATRLVITQSPAEVIVEGNTGIENSMQTAVYRLDGSQNSVPGPLGWDTRATAAWRDGALVVTIVRAIDGPDGRLTFEIKDVYRVAGDVLTLERSQGSATRRMVYGRM